jgi:EmrB/QacA subfamily drug resistance transporter
MSEMASVTAAAQASLRERRWVLLLACLASFLVGLDALVVATALPTLHQEYGGGVASLSWTVNAYQLAFAASILTGATLGDRLGRRRVFVGGVVVFVAASAMCALSPSLSVLIAARSLQGIGGGVAVPLTLALIADSTPAGSRGKAMGIWGAVTGLAVATGPIVGGAIVEGLAWQWIFWLNVPVGLFIAVAARRTLSERIHDRRRRADSAGLLLSTGGVFAIAQALIRADGTGWTSPSVAGGLLLGLSALAGFVVVERRISDAMMPQELFGNRGFSIGCIAGFAVMAGVFGFGFLAAQYLQLALGNSPFGVGLRLLPATGLALVLSPLAGRLSDRVGPLPLIFVGLTLQGGGLVLAGVVVTTASGYASVVVPWLFIGAGIAIAFPTVAAAVLRSVSPQQTSVASGVSNTFRQVGAVFGVAIAAAVFAANGNYGTSASFVAGFRPAFAALGAVCLIGAAPVAWALVAPRRVLA